MSRKIELRYYIKSSNGDYLHKLRNMLVWCKGIQGSEYFNSIEEIIGLIEADTKNSEENFDNNFYTFLEDGEYKIITRLFIETI